MTKRPAFWLLLAVGAIGAAVFAYFSFSKAFPIVSLDLRMDRSTALRDARVLASENGWGPEKPFRQAATFGVDDTVRTFVELQGGGKDAFREMLARRLYAAYTWSVRNFREGEAHETLVRFTPDGAPYGFREKLRENEPGPSLTEEDARQLAERQAVRRWHVDLEAFRPVESSHEVRSSGRTDYTFVYERIAEHAGAGRYRLRLVVSGDRLTELTHFLKVPEAFARHYEELRSANNGIAFGAAVAMVVLYLIGGGVVGVFLMLRKGWVLWRQPLIWGAVVSLVQALAQLNEWPLTWMDYDTALPGNTFFLQRLSLVFGLFAVNTLLLTLSFMAAESLSRRAFPHHPQQWRLWSRPAAGSVPVLGRTVGGYLYTGLEFAYIVGFYLVASRVFGWWTPSESLVEPNILATYLPWLSAVAPSMQAGIWEESLFRALPIAGAALLGDRFGHRRAWIIGAVILQAVVFGSAHANYPSEPAFSRPVELILPSLIWGIVYLNFGLLPTAITHYLFDLVLFGLPLFTASSAHAWIDQGMVVVCMLVPLGIVLWAGARARGWKALDPSLLNQAWSPAPPPAAAPEPTPYVAPAAGVPRGRLRLFWVLGLLGLAVWVVPFFGRPDTARFRIDRGEAKARALEALAARGFVPSPAWRVLVSVDSGPGIKDHFVWRTSGSRAYQRLLGTYIDPPRWLVRVATFEGNVADRAEEWQAEIGGDGTALRVKHRLPQGRPGATLEEGPARSLAQAEVRERFQLDPLRLKEVSAVSNQLPQRRDWTFTFADTLTHALKQGELRLEVEIAGDRVVDSHRYVFVPETWERSYRGTESLLGILRSPRFMLSILVVLTGAVIAIIAWSRRRFPSRVAIGVFWMLLGATLLATANRWPAIEYRFSTAQPLGLQVSIAVIAAVLSQVIFAAVIALLAALAHGQVRAGAAGARAPWSFGVAIGLFAAGVLALESMIGRSGAPSWLNYTPAESFFAPFGDVTSASITLLIRAAVLMFALSWVQRATQGWTRQRLAFGALLFLFGALTGQVGYPQSVGVWLAQSAVSGLLLVLVYALALSLDLTVVPVALGTLAALGALRSAVWNAYPFALAGLLLGAVLAFGVAWWWFRRLHDAAGGAVADHSAPPTPDATAGA